MNFTDEGIEELRKIMEQDRGEPFTTHQARDAARRLMTFYGGYIRWLGTQEYPSMPPHVSKHHSEESAAPGV
jgi:hypothetical protein